MNGSELRSCVTVDVNVLGSPVLTFRTICGRKATLKKKRKLNGCRYGWIMDWFTGRGIGPFSLNNIMREVTSSHEIESEIGHSTDLRSFLIELGHGRSRLEIETERWNVQKW